MRSLSYAEKGRQSVKSGIRVVAVTLLMACAGVVLLRGGQSTSTDDKRMLFGVWDLVSLEDQRANGEVVYWLGKHPNGTLTYTPSGRLAVQFMRDPRPTFAEGNVWSPGGLDLLPMVPAVEIRDALAGYYAYFGSYDVDERAHTVTHHVTASLRSHEVGLNYVRPYELRGDRLVLRYPVLAEGGETRTRVVVWHRAETLH